MVRCRVLAHDILPFFVAIARVEIKRERSSLSTYDVVIALLLLSSPSRDTMISHRHRRCNTSFFVVALEWHVIDAWGACGILMLLPHHGRHCATPMWNERTARRQYCWWTVSEVVEFGSKGNSRQKGKYETKEQQSKSVSWASPSKK